jgi:hypothetical protein
MNLSQTELKTYFEQGMSRISGQFGEPTRSDFEKTIDDLRKASSGSPVAKAKLAVLSAMGAGTDLDMESANKLFLDSAMSGFPSSVRDLGVLVLMSGTNEGLGAGLLCRAASSGDWIAGFLILRQACRGIFYLQSDKLLGLASQMSDAVPLKSQIWNDIGKLPEKVSVVEKTNFHLETCERALAQSGVFSEVKKTQLNAENPAVASFENVLTPVECDYLIATSCSTMQASKVVSSYIGNSVNALYRTSDGTALLPHMLNYPTVRIIEKLSSAANTAPHNGEFLSLLRYSPGQEYRPHHDFLAVDSNDYSMVNKCGQRRATLLTYLNDAYEGGETEFPKLDIAFKGRTGDGLYSENTDDTGNPIEDSLHAGLPVHSGEKWLATLWIREKPFWPWAREI